MAPDSFSTEFALDGKLKAVSKQNLIDGHRATTKRPENSFDVDLDAEKGQTPQANKPNIHRVVIKLSKQIQLETVRAYLDGKIDFNNGVLEGISKALSFITVTSALLIPFRFSGSFASRIPVEVDDQSSTFLLCTSCRL